MKEKKLSVMLLILDYFFHVNGILLDFQNLDFWTKVTARS